MSRGRLVYSTGGGPAPESCRRCGQAPCACDAEPLPPPEQQRVHVRHERSGRRGKSVTVAGPLRLDRDAARRLAREIKRDCGAGGTLRDGPPGDGPSLFLLEVQGDRVDDVVRLLRRRGYDARRGSGR